jgi:hypothetical protein
MFQWHSETFSVPRGARLIATGAHHQAFAIGALHIGVQFHCEIDRFKIESWLKVPESDDIDRYAGSPAVKHPRQSAPRPIRAWPTASGPQRTSTTAGSSASPHNALVASP